MDLGRGVLNQGLGSLDVMSGQNKIATGNYQMNQGFNQIHMGQNMNMNQNYNGYRPPQRWFSYLLF